ncbi:MAG: TonB-dependent receptor plug domain-containing protein, partial [Muribaculaceae bacterium]|nr:TonB-dependent receptor plug domain-containing protein [Muribaculaceae bacterium]
MIFLVTFLLLPLAALAKNYDVSFKRTPAEAAITQLEQVSGHDFVYQKELVAGSRILVNGSFKNESLEKILDEVIGRQLGLKWKIVNNTVVLSKPAVAKGRIITVKGIVRDNQGDPIPGASVKVIGEPMGVATDADGQFTLNVPMGATLAFTYIGMQPQDIRVTDTKPLDVEMQESTNMLSEVVITGYQELKKEKMTGAITTISADKLEDRYTPNLIQNLEGRVAGLSTYGGKPVIRGLGTLHGSTNPLLVVDGLPIEGSLDDLNPYDIASINVLKDAAASAIYGARAGNGIIVVTTKSANKKGKIDIDFTTNITVYEKTNYDYAANFYMTPEQQIETEGKYWDYYYFNNEGEINDPIGTTTSSIERGSTLTPLNMAYYKLAKGEINQTQFDQTVAKLKTYNYARDYEKNMTHREVLQQYNLSLRGSSDKFRNNLVMNYKKDNTELLNHHNDWLNIYYKGSYDIASWLTATFSINGIYANNQSYGNDYNSSMFNPWA